MESHEIYRNGVLISKTLLDYDKCVIERHEMVDNRLSVVEERAMTTEEISGSTSQERARSSDERIRAALSANKAYLALTTPTNAQAAAQIKSLTRQVSGLLKLQLREFS